MIELILLLGFMAEFAVFFITGVLVVVGGTDND